MAALVPPAPIRVGGPGLAALAVLLVAALGLAGLHHLIGQTNTAAMGQAFHAIGPLAIAASMSLTVLSYLALTLYDHVALRIAGHRVPWQTAALASFCSYTISHNLGLALITGGSARLRIYGAAGLGSGDVARVIASASLAFWGGVFTMAALVMAVHPVSVMLGTIALNAEAQRAAGIAMLMVAAGVLAGLRPVPITVRIMGWALLLPSRRQALGQIGIACIDLTLASTALFVLAPHAGYALYPTFFLAYALAIILALISHVPGGMGVFEAVFLAVLPGMDRPGLMAALILYRLIYYLAPLAIALLLMAEHEGRLWNNPLRHVLRALALVLRGFSPTLLATLTAIGGAMLLVSGSLPAVPARFHALSQLAPMPFVEASHLAASVTGGLLMLLASGLYRRLDGAFWLTRLLLVAGAIFSLAKGLDYEEAIVLLLIAGLLQWSRRAFYRRTSLTSGIFTPRWIIALGIAVGLSIWIGFVAYRHVDYQNDLWWQFGRHRDASRFLRAALATGVLVVGAAVRSLLRPAPAHGPALADCPGISRPALALAQRTDALLALTGDKLFEVSPSGRAFLMYQIQGHSWIVMSDPVGDPAEWRDLLWQIRERADAAQGRLLLYQISMDALPLAIELGLSIVKYGEEARIDLTHFSMTGSAARPLRHAARRAERDGAQFDIIPAADVSALLPQLRAISDHWLAGKGGSEKSFSVGRFDNGYLQHCDCAVVRQGDRIVAFANILATANGNELSVDMMRHDEGSPYGVMDFMFSSLLLWGQEQGYRWFSLGLTPLSGLEARRLSPLWVKAAAFLYRHGDGFYGFGGLRAYKSKFAPSWEPRFIAGPQGISLGRAMVDLQRLVGGGRASAAARMQAASAAREDGGQ